MPDQRPESSAAQGRLSDQEVRYVRETKGVDAAKVLVLEAEVEHLRSALTTLRDAWNAHMETCPQHAALPDLPAPSWDDLEAWRDAPSGTASA